MPSSMLMFSVRLLYHNTTDTLPAPSPLILPGCTELCPLHAWTQLTHSLTPEDWRAECAVTDHRGQLGQPLMVLGLILLAVTLVTLTRWVSGILFSS